MSDRENLSQSPSISPVRCKRRSRSVDRVSKEKSLSRSVSPQSKKKSKMSRSRSRSYRKKKHSKKYSPSRSRSRSYRKYSRSRSRGRRSSYDDRYRSPSRSPLSKRRRHRGDRVSKVRKKAFVFSLKKENPKESRCLGVFGMSLQTDERTLREIFERYGPVDEVQIVYDYHTGRSRGFAFVYYKYIEDAIDKLKNEK